MKIKKTIISLLTMMSIFNLPTNRSYTYADNVYSTEYIKELETQFISNSYFGNSKEDYEYKAGNIPILISAPHTVKQLRNGEYKKADIYTGALAKVLQEATGAHLIYKASTNGDENHTTEETEYRKKIKEIVEKNNIKIVLDLHGMLSSRDSDIDIGTGGKDNRNLLGQDQILSIVESSLGDANYTVNKYFSGSMNHTISNYCSTKLGVPTLQLEINQKYRTSESENFTYMANKLTHMINELSEKGCTYKVNLKSIKYAIINMDTMNKIKVVGCVVLLGILIMLIRSKMKMK